MKICLCPKNNVKGYESVESEEVVLSSQSLEPKAESSKSFLKTFLITTIFGIAGLTYWGILSQWNTIENETQTILSNRKEKENNSLVTRMDRIEKLFEIWSNRTWLLSLAVNENASISKEIDDRLHRHYPHRDYISFDKEWKLNKKPESMYFNEEQKNILERSIRKF